MDYPSIMNHLERNAPFFCENRKGVLVQAEVKCRWGLLWPRQVIRMAGILLPLGLWGLKNDS